MSLLELESGRRPIPVDPHAADCAACAQLLDEILAESALFARIRRPESPELMERLAQEPPDFAARRAAAPVLDFLAPGALRTPEPSRELMSRLAFLPTRAARRAKEPREKRGFFAVLLGDWRITVAGAYALTMILVAVLRVDPLSMARETAADLTTAGERAVAEARVEAVKRIGSSALAKAAAPLTTRLEYRVYRTVTAARARATAYSQLVFEKVFGGTLEASGETAKKRGSEPTEPREQTLRS